MDDKSDRIKTWRAYQRDRERAITLGCRYERLAIELMHDCGAGHAAALRNMRRATGLLLKACDQFALAGLTHKARTVWRCATQLHRAMSREAGI